MSSVVATAAERWAATVSTSRRRIAPQKPSRTSRGARMAEWLAEWLAGWRAGWRAALGKFSQRKILGGFSLCFWFLADAMS